MSHNYYLVYEYDLVIGPVTWEDRGEWKCGLPDEGLQSSVGKLEINIPLDKISLGTSPHKYLNPGTPLVVDEGDSISIWCRTSPTYPPPNALRITVGDKIYSKNEIKTQIKKAQNGQAELIGSIILRNVVRDLYHEKIVKCEADWTDQRSGSLESIESKSGFSSINVFFPSENLQVQTQPVQWNQFLQAKCSIGVAGNPAPKISWFLGKRKVASGSPVLEIKVDRSDDNR